MQSYLVFVPVVVQILLTIYLFVRLANARATAARLGLVDETRRALHDDAWPDNVIQLNNCIRNQFESPVLFYVLVISLWLTHGINVYVHVFAWIFALSRIVHAWIHVGSNHVPRRRKAFIVGGLSLIALTVMLIYSIAVGAGPPR